MRTRAKTAIGVRSRDANSGLRTPTMFANAIQGDRNGSGGSRTLSDDEVFDVLSNRRRRYAIHALKHTEEADAEPLDLAELSALITAWEEGVDPESVAYEDRRHVYCALQRVHLPAMEENGVLTVSEENVIEPGEALDDLEVYVEVLRDREIPWNLYYVGLGALSAALLAAVVVGVPGMAAIPPLSIGAFVVVAFGVSAVAHYVVGRHARLGSSERPPELRERS